MKNNADEPGGMINFREWLGAIDDALLGEILTHRPDVIVPDVPGITTLAGRLQLRASIARALAKLDVTALLTLETAARLGGELNAVSLADVTERILSVTQTSPADSPVDSPTAAAIEAAFHTLVSFALVYGTPDAFKVVAEVMPSLPLDWQLLPEPDAPQLSHQQTQEFIAESGTRCQKILATLLDSGGTGLTKDAEFDADPSRPIPRLLAAGLLVRVDTRTVRLAPTTKRVLWGLEPLVIPFTPPHPAHTPTQSELAKADQQGAVAGLEVVRMMRQLIEYLTDHPASCLRDGSLGVRAVQRMAKHLQVDALDVCRLVGIGEAARLLARDIPDPPPENNTFHDYLCPTELATQWLQARLDSQWADLVRAWWHSPWAAWKVEKPVNLLSGNTARSHLQQSKELLIQQYVRAGKLTVTQAMSMVGFYAPLHASRLRGAQEIVAEASWLGVLTPNGEPTSVAIALIEQPGEIGKATYRATPETVDYVIAQGDMTILAPGPLTPQLRQKIELIAEVESAGLASVYRISEASLRGALDAGVSAGDIAEMLEQHTVGEVPQSLVFLLNDLARQHGNLRGGPAMCYLRCEDTELLEQAVQAIPALRQLAPTVAVSQLPLGSMIETLRRAGFQPLAEDGHGIALDLRPPPRRVPTPPANTHADSVAVGELTDVIRKVRANERNAATASEGSRSTADILGVLQAAVRSRKTVTLGFVDKHGIATARVVQPLTVSAGQVDAVDKSTGAVHRYQLHRITTVVVDN